MSGSVSLYTTCKDGWIAYRGSCYLFNMTPMQFTTAEQFCRQHDNSHFVHVDDAIENSFLKDRMRMFKDSIWWVEITDEEVEGVWKWFDTDDVATYTDFVPGDAGNHYAEDCAVFGYGVQYRWVDLQGSSPPLCGV
ncbi:perlucin-like protein [Dreissena polymorpha]|uniref:C-type lectin domain-containing protein n=1 Tax=Dreissena polymorpha TaxID=45954 RepID=A0A9D4RIL5_DREPO|nr:perlucin-like protein [Dreissena polymorpha]KAH3869956.1 hypothetical protein DPMN_033134 [Dreissena polymorpha]